MAIKVSGKEGIRTKGLSSRQTLIRKQLNNLLIKEK